VPLASVIVGPLWRWLNPLRTLHLLMARALRTDPSEGLRPLPVSVGYWPAATGLLAFTWLELVAPNRATTPVLRAFFAAYGAVHLLCAAMFGDRWFDRGDAFEVWSTLLGRFSPVGRRGDGRLVLRSPLDGLDATPIAPGLPAVAVVLLGSTAYDGLSNAPFWFRRVQSAALPAVVVGTLALAAMVAIVAVTFTVATMLSGVLSDRSRTSMPTAFAHSILPIALGYVLAHYYSLLVLVGQQTVALLSDPLGTGADWLGTADRGISATGVRPGFVAGLQVVSVVTGHVLGVVLAHDRAVRLFPRRRAVVGQLPLLVLMVGYTLGGLSLLFAA
jgi:hypothetical protein